MQSVIQEKSYGSVKVFWLNRKLLRQRLMSAVKTLAFKRHEVVRVILFGSVAEEREIPGSDVDIMIIVEECKERFLDRSDKYFEYFENVGIPVELFVYSRDEVEAGKIPLVRTAMRDGKVLFERR